MQILVADDDPDSRGVLATTLGSWGFDVFTVDTGVAALDVLTTHEPRLAILDWMLPGIDGIEICRRVWLEPALSPPYIILLTDRTNQAEVVAALLEAGADDYMRKPVDADELRARVTVAMRLLEAKAESERLLSSISSILIGIDEAGRITRWNAVARDTFAVRPSEAIGRTLTECGISWADPTQIERIFSRASERVTHLDDIRFRDARGRDRLLGLTVTPVHSEDGRTGHVVLGADVTDRRLLEAQLRQAQKLEGIGQLAAGIAHEINTPMQYIGDNARFLRDSVAGLQPVFASVAHLCALRSGGDADALAAGVDALAKAVEQGDLEYVCRNLPDAVAQSLEGVEHVSRIVRAMKEFSHPGTGEKVDHDLNRAIETTLMVARNELKYVADVDLSLDVALPRVRCLPGELNQVFLNIFVNAAHAIAEVVTDSGARGRISVSTRRTGDQAEIRIGDTGGGIPEAIRPRVFEPFFTTKDVGRGTGQGLAMAYATIVHQHGGQIWFDSVSGQGTTFVIRLPLAAAPDVAGEPAVPAPAAALSSPS